MVCNPPPHAPRQVLFLRVTHIPTLTDANLSKLVAVWLFWAAALHAGVTAWMLGNPEFLYRDARNVWETLGGA